MEPRVYGSAACIARPAQPAVHKYLDHTPAFLRVYQLRPLPCSCLHLSLVRQDSAAHLQPTVASPSATLPGSLFYLRKLLGSNCMAFQKGLLRAVSAALKKSFGHQC